MELRVKIELLYIADCPNYPVARERVKAALSREGLQAEIQETLVLDESQARALRFPGSPTIRVNGLDVERESRSDDFAGLACRWYQNGLPSEELIRAALREALEH
jgi:hypothetical protein